MSILMPAIWLIVCIAGLPQLSETVYTPSLPTIAKALDSSAAMIEYTLTIYLFAFALGTFFWGWLSDKRGRKPCMVAGLVLFVVGCIGCYYSYSIELLLASRFIQAFGGSVGSVLSQAVCRDAFSGPALGKVYSSVGSALALFPAVGPVIGGFIAQYYEWHCIFLFLILAGLLLVGAVVWQLAETHLAEKRVAVPIATVARQLLSDSSVLLYGLVIGIGNGINFSYFAEGSFSLIEILGLSASQYGMSFSLIAASTMCGGLLSRRLQGTYSSARIMQIGLYIMLAGSLCAAAVTSMYQWLQLGVPVGITGIIGGQMIIMFGVCMATSNALSLALVKYKWCIGTASSLFGLGYYCVISLVTFIMGSIHTGSIIIMPWYFVLLSGGMVAIGQSIKQQ